MNHIRRSIEENKAWCGEELDGSFNFKDTEAAVINGAMKGELVPCTKCVDEVIGYLIGSLKE